MRTTFSSFQELSNAVSDHFVPSSLCASALVQDDSSKTRFEIGYKCSRCGQSWGIDARHLKDTIGQKEPDGTIRVWSEREVTA